jgi:hypothetical protein
MFAQRDYFGSLKGSRRVFIEFQCVIPGISADLADAIEFTLRPFCAFLALARQFLIRKSLEPSFSPLRWCVKLDFCSSH